MVQENDQLLKSMTFYSYLFVCAMLFVHLLGTLKLCNQQCIIEKLYIKLFFDKNFQEKPFKTTPVFFNIYKVSFLSTHPCYKGIIIGRMHKKNSIF